MCRRVVKSIKYVSKESRLRPTSREARVGRRPGGSGGGSPGTPRRLRYTPHYLTPLNNDLLTSCDECLPSENKYILIASSLNR